MGKLNLQAALDAVYSEKLPKAASHPLFGLRDSRGWLTRYPENREFKPRWWLEQYLATGAGCDDCNVWGCTPYVGSHEDKILEHSPTMVGRLVKEAGRFDNVERLLEDLPAGIVSGNITFPDLKTLCIGYKRSIVLDRYGARPVPYMSLGHMPKRKFYSRLARTATKLPSHVKGGGSQQFSDFYWEAKEYFPDPETWSPFTRHFMACIRKYKARARANHHQWTLTGWSAGSWSNYHRGIPRTKKVTEMVIAYNRSKKYQVPRDYDTKIMQLPGELQYSKSLLGDGFLAGVQRMGTGTATATTAGRLWVNRHYAITTRWQAYPIHQVGKYFTFQAPEAEPAQGCEPRLITFVWPAGSDFGMSHAEGYSLKEALILISQRSRKGGLIFSLNNVRSDVKGTAGFCLSGVKDFARRRMPFLYRLIEPYRVWNDIPRDIMEIDFHLKDRSIFYGYPQP